MAIEIVDFPINRMVIFHSFLYVYQRVPCPETKRMVRWWPVAAWVSPWGQQVLEYVGIPVDPRDGEKIHPNLP